METVLVKVPVLCAREEKVIKSSEETISKHRFIQCKNLVVRCTS